jgi:hypothetical protein
VYLIRDSHAGSLCQAITRAVSRSECARRVSIKALQRGYESIKIAQGFAIGSERREMKSNEEGAAPSCIDVVDGICSRRR